MIIGITTTLNEADGFQRVNVEYIESVAATGALPVLLSPVAGGVAANETLAEKAWTASSSAGAATSTPGPMIRPPMPMRAMT